MKSEAHPHRPGKVYLVGAGPGDPGLLTQRACELLRACDVIAFDALISPSIIALCPMNKELIAVGYRGYGSKGLGYRLHPSILAASLAGKSVVRLKSGDPLIYGRLSQECEELLENGIEFEIVPGVTSALAAAAYAGFPMTDRDCSSDVVITSGHDLSGGTPSQSDWEALGKSTGTIAVYMAATKIRENCRRLIESGRAARTPAAFISNATRGSQRVVVASLSELGEKVGEIPKGTPALIVAGEVVSQRRVLDWRAKKPLAGVTALLVRARPGGSKIAALLKELGADIVEAPWIEKVALAEFSELDAALEALPEANRILFSCEEGVSSFFERMLSRGWDARRLREFRILALGESVRERLWQTGVLADETLEGHCDNALEKSRGALGKGPIWVVGSRRARAGLLNRLKAMGLEPRWIATYEMDARFPPIAAPTVDFVIFPSSTSVELLANSAWSGELKNTPALTLGPVALRRALEKGFSDVQAAENDRPSALIDLILKKRGMA